MMFVVVVVVVLEVVDDTRSHFILDFAVIFYLSHPHVRAYMSVWMGHSITIEYKYVHTNLYLLKLLAFSSPKHGRKLNTTIIRSSLASCSGDNNLLEFWPIRFLKRLFSSSHSLCSASFFLLSPYFVYTLLIYINTSH